MRILLHICCAPCSIYPIEVLKNDEYQIHGCFFNPNIHPYTEYKKRLDTLINYSDKIDLPITIIDEYNIQEFLRDCAYKENERCIMCYTKRLDRVAIEAKSNGYDAFSTTLLVSPYQKHELIKKIGEELEEKYSIKFVYKDFRLGFRKGQQVAKELELYRQQYCGCIYSEAERYLR